MRQRTHSLNKIPAAEGSAGGRSNTTAKHASRPKWDKGHRRGGGAAAVQRSYRAFRFSFLDGDGDVRASETLLSVPQLLATTLPPQ